MKDEIALKKRKPENLKPDFGELILELFEECPIIIFAVMLLALVVAPFYFIYEAKTQRKLIKQHGIIDCSIKSFSEPITNTAEYIYALSKRIYNKTTEVGSKKYLYYMGYMDSDTFLKEVKRLEKDQETVDFIKYHLGKTLGIDTLQGAQTYIEYLRNKQFKEANDFLDNNVIQEIG